jgi:mannosyl-oligosaccharide alpha-1,3-glucosidase
MLVRWYWVGAFSPFFRAHAHLDSKRREPYLLDEPHKSTVRNILRLRYSLLPVWYTAFRETSVTGLPLLRYTSLLSYRFPYLRVLIYSPHFVMFPQDEAGFSIDDQFYVGSSGLLVKPVTRPGVTEETVYLPEDKVKLYHMVTSNLSCSYPLHEKIYYDYFTYQTYRGSAKGKHVSVPAALHQMPLLVRGGSIIPTRERPRRASSLMHRDPFTLRVALDNSLTARGELYLDDGVTYAYKNGNLAWRGLSADKISNGAELRLSNTDLAVATPHSAVEGNNNNNNNNNNNALAEFRSDNPFQAGIMAVRVEKIVVLGLADKPKRVTVEVGSAGGDRNLEWEFGPGVAAVRGDRDGGVASVLTIKDPGLGVAIDWAIRIAL